MPKYKPNDAGTEGLDRIQRLEKHVADSPTLTPSSSLDNVVQAGVTGAVPLVLKAAAGQTADLLQIQDSSGALLGGFSATGVVNGGSLSALGDITISADTGASGTGDIVISTKAIERGRIHNAGDLLFKYAVALNGGGFTNSFDTALWVAPSIRSNPTNNSQGFYVQHRVAGDLGGLVHDAAASELRFNGVSNGGTGQNAHEASLVVTAGANNIASANGLLVNFHTEGTPSGSFTSIALMRASAIPALTGTFSIGTAYGVYIETQTVATTNYSLYVAGGNSVIQGQIVPSSTSTSGLIIRGLPSQGTSQPMFAIQNSTPTTLFQLTISGTGGFGGSVANTTLWVNNNNASTTTLNMVVRAKASQSVDMTQWQDSTPTTHMSVTKDGLLRWNAAADVQTTVGAAGAASAVPATPSKYLKVVGDDGTTYVVPAYAAA